MRNWGVSCRGVLKKKVKSRKLSLWISRPHGSLCVPLCSQNPDIVLVHYLNVPALEDCGKGCSPIFCSISSDRREWLKWSREELLGQLKPMCKEQDKDRTPRGEWEQALPKVLQLFTKKPVHDHFPPRWKDAFLQEF